MSSIRKLKPRLSNFIETDFGLLDELLRMNVLTRREIADVRSERTVYKRNDALLDLLVDEEQCSLFLHALRQSGQEHVEIFIRENGGQNVKGS